MSATQFAAAILLVGGPAHASALPSNAIGSPTVGTFNQTVQPSTVSVVTSEPATPPVQAKPSSATAPAASAGSPDSDQSDIVVTGRLRPTVGDPLEKINAKSFEATQVVDEALVGPLALAYERKVPGSFRVGLRNILKNLHEPDVFLNFLLQHKVGKAAETFGRFTINSTIGAVGLLDIAKRHPFNLPRRPNGFADTLGFYGVKPGPFFFLPLVGPTTLRDLIGNGLDGLVLPTSIGRPFSQLTYTVPTGVIRALDHRAEFDEQLTKLRNGSVNPYVASRDFYLQRRQAEIDELRGKRPVLGSVDSGHQADPPTPSAAASNVPNATAEGLPDIEGPTDTEPHGPLL